MIRTEKEYEAAKMQLSKFEEFVQAQRKELLEQGLSPDQVEKSLSSSVTYGRQGQEEVQLYETLKRGELPPRSAFAAPGQYLVAARIARGVTQRELAERLGVKESIVSRDERNEYQGVSMEKADRVLSALGYELNVAVPA